eukprot:TRINITY_DN13511_c0_g1_i1.p1 TRINITY_DN13511_c0_g1~~TRINITY_DN13511_c0_g1_i1.p1  ORF type:complete len:600 (+),score=155.71 TRINITY_DN13511_c0_g1_i1:97-1896(+)
MAMVGRSRRNDFFGCGGTTGPLVGPGSYNQNGAGSGVKYSVPPFGSSCERQTGEKGDVTLATPGPGYYQPGELVVGNQKASGASSQFSSRTARMVADAELLKRSALPGPGAYTNLSQWGEDGPSIKGSRFAGASPHRGDAARGNNIHWKKVTTAPSIPAPCQSYGYEEGPTGELVQGRPPAMGHKGRDGDTAGPGSYNPNDLVTKPVRTALNFGRSRAKRGEDLDVPKEKAGRPGPGAYEVRSTMGGAPADPTAAVTNSCAFASTTERSFVPKDASLLPGPGAYNQGSAFDAKDSFHHPPAPNVAVIPRTEVHAQRENAPGPGQYAAKSDFDPPKDRWKEPKSGAAFGSTGLRFSVPLTTEQLTPGPGYYSDGAAQAKNMSDAVQKRVTGRYGVFGTTSQRFPENQVHNKSLAAGGVTANPENRLTGPGSYNPKPTGSVKPAEARRRDHRTAVFVSNVERIPKGKDPTPGVGDYNLPPTLKTTAQGTPARSFFNANELRFKPTKPSLTPGPGEYQQDHMTLQSNVHGIGVKGRSGSIKQIEPSASTQFDKHGGKRPIGDRSVRFQAPSKRNQGPGPGYYDTGNSMLKRTFNITIGDSWD